MCGIIVSQIKSHASICDRCWHHIRSLRYLRRVDLSGHPIFVCFRYSSIIRELILRAKVKNESPALAAIVAMVRDSTNELINSHSDGRTLVIAAPSSLRSRIYGRFDVAQVLAASLIGVTNRASVSRFRDFWRIKRAGQNRRNRLIPRPQMLSPFHDILKKTLNFLPKFNVLHEMRDKISSYSCILVVDDVLTTGFTMGTLINHLKTLGAHRIEGLVVAAADPISDSCLWGLGDREKTPW